LRFQGRARSGGVWPVEGLKEGKPSSAMANGIRVEVRDRGIQEREVW